jgi:hypothetical protein
MKMRSGAEREWGWMSCTIQQRWTMDGNELLNVWNGDENELWSRKGIGIRISSRGQ